MSTLSESQQIDLAREVAALRRTVGKLLRRLDQPMGDRDLTIPQWCAKHNVSRAGFYKMKKAGRAPRVIENGGLRRITPAADADWEARAIRRSIASSHVVAAGAALFAVMHPQATTIKHAPDRR